MAKTDILEHVDRELNTAIVLPSMYKVILNNDDYTPMEFVIEVLKFFFKKSVQDANDIMLSIHHHGKGVCGIFPFGIAETKVSQVNKFARQNQHPLLCSLEKA